MKYKSIVVCMLVAFGVVILFMGASASQSGPAPALPERADTIDVGLVIDESGLSSTWNYYAYQGLQQAETDLGVTGSVYTPTSPSDYLPLMQQCVSDGNELCITNYFLLGEAVSIVAADNPSVKFAMIDSGPLTPADNIRAALFDSKQSAYLAGALAGMMTESDIIGAIGGMEIDPVIVFMDGYHNGAKRANRDVEVLMQYAGTFWPPEVGAQIAQDMIAQGADVIFAPAGPVGSGAVLTATQSGAWGIGVDVDFYYEVFGGGTEPGADKLLTSVIKRMDLAVYWAIEDVINSAFEGGEVLYGLAEGGVDLAPYHDTDPFVTTEMRDELAALRQAIIDGTIDVDFDGEATIFLPSVWRR